MESHEFVDRLFIRLEVLSKEELVSHYSSPPSQCLPLNQRSQAPVVSWQCPRCVTPDGASPKALGGQEAFGGDM